MSSLRSFHGMLTTCPICILASCLEQIPALSASPHLKETPLLSMSWSSCTALLQPHPCPCSTVEPQQSCGTGRSTPSTCLYFFPNPVQVTAGYWEGTWPCHDPFMKFQPRTTTLSQTAEKWIWPEGMAGV